MRLDWASRSIVLIHFGLIKARPFLVGLRGEGGRRQAEWTGK